MVRERLGPKPRPPQTLYTRERRNSDHGLRFWGHGLSWGVFWGRGRRGGSHHCGFGFESLMSRGRCGHEIARLWRLAAVVAASLTHEILRVPPKIASELRFFSGRRSEKPIDFCNGMVATGGRCDYAMQFLCC